MNSILFPATRRRNRDAPYARACLCTPGCDDLRPDHDTLETMKRNRALLIARARRLEKMGLAAEVRPGEWHISDRAEGTLRALGEREDIIKSMHRALARVF